MEYYQSDDELDLIMRPYFKWKFEGWKFATLRKPGEQRWTGFYVKNGDVLLLGYPTGDKKNITWFSNGQVFEGGPAIFGIDYNEFHEALKRYVEKIRPETKIESIM